MVKVLPLVGPDTYWALQSYIKLLFGLKMLPMYMGMTLEELFESIESMSVADRQKIVRQAVLLVTLDRDELQALTRFAADKNGVPFTKENTKAMPADEYMQIIHAVVQEIAAIDNNFLTASEKKN